MKKSEKKKIVKRHFDTLAKCSKLEEKYFMRKVKIRSKAIDQWKDNMKSCL